MAAAISSFEIKVTWTDTNSKEDGYEIQRSLSAWGGFSSIATTPANATSYSDTNLPAGATRFYRIRAVGNGNQVSAFSSVVSATTDSANPAAPTDTTGPTVSINWPSSGTTYTSAGTVTIWTSVADNVGVTKVEFYDNGVLKAAVVHSDEYAFTYTWSYTSSDNGSHNWTAKAYDAAGNSSVSDSVTITVNIGGGTGDITAPSVAITWPSSGTTYTSAGTVTIWTSVADNVGVTKVEFYDNGVLKVAVVHSDEYAFTYTWSYTSSDNGSHNWTAKAYDAAGNSSVSASVTVTVNIGGGTGDTTVPSVAITWPSSGTTYTSEGTVTIWTSAADNVGVTKVEFYDGAVLKHTDMTNAYTYSWPVTDADNGAHSWTAKAYDAAGNAATSSAVILTINIDPIVGGEVLPPEGAPWLFDFGGTGEDIGRAVAQDPFGDIVMAGSFSGSANFGGATLINAGGSDIVLAKYSGVDGSHLWSRRFGDTGSEYPRGVAVDSGGDILVIGDFTGSGNVGGGTADSSGAYDIFLAKYSGMDGSHQWSFTLGAFKSDRGLAVAVDAAGNVFVAGQFSDTVDFGGEMMTSSGGGVDTFVAKYSGSDGGLIWVRRFPNTSSDGGSGVAVDSLGNVVVVGFFVGAIKLDDIDFVSAEGVVEDIYVVKLRGADGTHLWSRTFGSLGHDSASAVAIDGWDNVIVTGYFYDAIDLGGGTILNAAGMLDAFVAKYAGSSGDHLWSRGFGGTGYDYGNHVAVDQIADVVVTGRFQGTAEFGSGSLSSSGGYDVFVAKYDGADGYPLWSDAFGGAGSDNGRCVVTRDGSGEVVATGSFQGTADFGGETPISAGGSDVFLMSLAP